jgi:hypothetical protein
VAKIHGHFFFHFFKLPVFKNYKFLNPPLRTSQGEFVNVSTLKTIDARFARAIKNKSFAPLELTKTSTIFPYKPFVPMEQSFQK